jgi:hypothetical protein
VLTAGQRHEQVALEALLDQGAVRRRAAADGACGPAGWPATRATAAGQPVISSLPPIRQKNGPACGRPKRVFGKRPPAQLPGQCRTEAPTRRRVVPAPRSNGRRLTEFRWLLIRSVGQRFSYHADGLPVLRLGDAPQAGTALTFYADKIQPHDQQRFRQKSVEL